MPFQRMNPTIKKRWVKALRSGEYVKTKGRLCDTPRHRLMSINPRPRAFYETAHGFCCLGVLGDLAVQDGAAEWGPVNSNDELVLLTSTGNASTCMLPGDIRAWAGLDADAQDYLARVNDDGWSHRRIADWIEKRL